MSDKPLSRRHHRLIAGGLFCLTFLVYWRSPSHFMFDSMWAIHISSSIINAGDINLDEYESIVANQNFSATITSGDSQSILPYHPIGSTILITPIVWIIEQTKQLPEEQSFYQYLQQTSPFASYLVTVQHFSAALFTALVVPLLYYVGRKKFNTITAVAGVLVFAFGTSAYSTASRVLWPHGPSMLMLIIALALFIKAENNPSVIQWASIPLAFSYIIRPTNTIPIIVLTMVVFLRYRKQLLVYLLNGTVIAALFFWFNYLSYGHFLSPYYLPQRVGSTPYFGEALIGNLISPARGLFVFSPVMLFALLGVFVKFRRGRLVLLDSALIVIITLHWIMISSFRHWWGGGSYGPRLFADMMPFMTYFLMSGLHELDLSNTKTRLHQFGGVVFVVLAFISLGIHAVGANQNIIGIWSRWPVNVETHPSFRLWNWKDPLFLRTVDDFPFFTLPADIPIDAQSDLTSNPLRILLQNNGNEAYFWEVKLPESLHIQNTGEMDDAVADSGVAIIVGDTAVSPQTYQWLSIVTEQPPASYAEPSLGAMVVTAKTLDGKVRSEQVIPVYIVGNGRNWRESDALNEKVWLPTDIRINGSKADNTLYGLYGPGWYALESPEQYHWRWAQSPAELYVFSAKPQSITMELAFNSLHVESEAGGIGDIGQLQIMVGDEVWTGQISTDRLNQVPLSLDEGWNTLVFKLESGNFSPADLDSASFDKRVLSFSLDSINIVTDD